MVFPTGINAVTPILGHTSDSLEELVKNRDTQLPPPPTNQPSVPWVRWGHHCFKENPSGDWIGVAATFVNLCSKSTSEGLCSLRCGFKAFGPKPDSMKPGSRTDNGSEEPAFQLHSPLYHTHGSVFSLGSSSDLREDFPCALSYAKISREYKG